MLKINGKTLTDSQNLFLNSSTVTMLPVVSAEWNQNLFNPPYMTIAGTGVKETVVIPNNLTAITDTSLANPNFTTYAMTTTNGKGSQSFTVNTASPQSAAYKIVTYVLTDQYRPAILTSYAEGSATQYGSTTIDVNSFGWTKVITYVGSSSSSGIASTGANLFNLINSPSFSGASSGYSDPISSFTYTLLLNTYSSDTSNPILYYTEPEVYATTWFDYQHNTLWPTESVFSYFRPGESYVESGNFKYSLPSDFRSVNTRVLNSQAVDGNGKLTSPPKFPVTPIIQNPSFCAVSTKAPFYKIAMPNDMNPYKYFVSDIVSGYTPSISGIYEQTISANKIVIKFNTVMTTPTISVAIDGSTISVDGSTSIAFPTTTSSSGANPNNAGVLILYWTGTAWTKKKWGDPTASPVASMPHITAAGVITPYTTFKKITVTQLDTTINSAFSGYPARSSDFAGDRKRMHLVELSPRLELDLSDYVMGVDVVKSLDSKNTAMPISSINTDDASIILSAIPILSGNDIIPIFSSQSNLAINVLANMLRKNIKFYVSFNIKSNFSNILSNVNAYVPGGIYYSDTWDETDVKTVKVQCYDITRYLQTTPAPDYVANLKSVFEIITNIFDLVGYTDYDYDSLYSVCHDSSSPMDMAYYYCNSKDTTVIDAISQIFLANQIGAYIDEYGIMRFLSLSQILNNKTADITIDDANIITGGYSIANKAKPGKISVRYQSPKIKQSLALQNTTAFSSKTTPSFIYTTSNDVVWTQQNVDSVGFNHLSEDMEKDSNRFKLNVNDLLDIFHTYSLNNDGYASIENEIVSFLYKQYTIADGNGNPPTTVSVKNDMELQSEINRYIKKYESGLALSQLDDSGNSIKPHTANVTVTPTGYITDVQRGLFGTKMSSHKRITNLASKDLYEGLVDAFSNYTVPSSGTNTSIVNNKIDNINKPSVEKIRVTAPANKKVLIIPNETDEFYKTYSAKFDMYDNPIGSAGIFFNKVDYFSNMDDTYYVELVKMKQSGNSFKYYIIVSHQINGKPPDVLSFADVTGTASLIISNFEKIMYKVKNSTNLDINADIVSSSNNQTFVMTSTSGIISGMYVTGNGVPINTMVSAVSSKTITLTNQITANVKDTLTFSGYSYANAVDQTFNLKVNHYFNSSSTNGDDVGELVEVFLNNIEVNGWQVPNKTTPITKNELYSGWTATEKNKVTGLKKKVVISDLELITEGKQFGFFMTTAPTVITREVVAYTGAFLETTYQALFLYQESTNAIVGNLREIYACNKLLNERSVNYWFQDREFLNGLVQGQNLFSQHKSYMMQTTPEVLGINYYDVQYTNPAAVSVDVLPVEYLWYYFPSNEIQDQKYYQSQLVDEYSLSYSTPINTGFRAKMAIANNTSHMVYLNKESDSLNQFTVKLNLWTHEIIAPSDPEIIEKVLDQSNVTEVVQLDSPWIQSKDVANKLLSVIQKGIDGFSRDTTIQIFGNPLIQVGDIISLSYGLAGLNLQKYLVHSVTHNFSQGLKTTLVLNMLDRGVLR